MNEPIRTSKMKGVSFHTSTRKWVAFKMVDGKRIWLGRTKTEHQAVSRVNKFNRKLELESILKYVSEESKIDVSTISRENNIPFLKSLVTKIAFNVLDKVTLQEIADVLNVDHSSVSYYKKTLIPEINKIYKYTIIYLNYHLVDDLKMSNKITGYNNLLIEREILLRENSELTCKINQIPLSKQITEVELQYRQLPKEEQKLYDIWAKLKINLMPSNQKHKEIFEIINCQS